MLFLPACGGGDKKPADAPATTASAAASSAPSASSAPDPVASSAPATSAAPADSATAPKKNPTPEEAEAANYDDPNEHDGPIELTPLVPKNPPKTLFPKPTIGDRECLSGLAFVGEHKADYAVLEKQCGTPTGSVQYVAPAEGKLHAQKDKRDVFSFEVHKGMCYRYFAVADSGIADIDILVQKPNGALLATDKTTQPIAVINTSEPWCVTDFDQKLHFAVEVDGRGAGGYTFGVWVRPVKK
jgi:hypothetical protein